MKLLNIPACNCEGPFGQVIALTDAGETYCATCRQQSTKDKPHVVDIPVEIKPIVEAITSIAHLHIWEMRPSVNMQFFSDIVDVTILGARSRDFSGECRVFWGKQTFPLPGGIRPDYNLPRGKKIDLRKLPVCVTPEIRDFLKLLQGFNFLMTQIVPSDRNTMRMYLECWFGPDVHVFVKHEKLVVRIELAFSMDIADGINKCLNALNSYERNRDPIPLPYAAAARKPLEASREVNFALPSMCLALIDHAYTHAVVRLAASGPRYTMQERAEALAREYPEKVDLILANVKDVTRQGPDGNLLDLSCGEDRALRLVAQYARYHLQTIRERISAVQSETDEQISVSAHPKRIEELRLDSGADKVAKPHFDFIDAVYSLFLRIPAPVIKLEGNAAG